MKRQNSFLKKKRKFNKFESVKVKNATNTTRSKVPQKSYSMSPLSDAIHPRITLQSNFDNTNMCIGTQRQRKIKRMKHDRYHQISGNHNILSLNLIIK